MTSLLQVECARQVSEFEVILIKYPFFLKTYNHCKHISNVNLVIPNDCIVSSSTRRKSHKFNLAG